MVEQWLAQRKAVPGVRQFIGLVVAYQAVDPTAPQSPDLSWVLPVEGSGISP